MDIGQFEKLKVLGEGTFGKCYLVNNKSTNELCVLKQIDLNGMSDKEKQDTMKEARILEALDHPSIIKLIGSFKSRGGYLNIVMNYADGGDLAKAIRDAKGCHFNQNQILNWFTQISLALKHVHERKIIHRDLKCQNIFLTRDRMVKLGDFGIAKSLKQTIQKLKSVVGTPYYMSPEICQNKDYSFKTDIWSLGVILYEMCALKPPFDANSLGALALRILKGDYVPLPNIYSKELRKLIGEMLTIDPAKRPSIHQILKNPIIKVRIANYVTKSCSFIREPEPLREITPSWINNQSGQESERTKKIRVGSLFSPQSIPQSSYPQSPSFFPSQTPQNKPISLKPKENTNQKESKPEPQKRAMRRRQISQPNLAGRLYNQNKHRKINNDCQQLAKKKSDDSGSAHRKPKNKSRKIEDNVLSQIEQIKEMKSEVKQIHRQLTGRNISPEDQNEKYLTEYPIEQLQEILFQEQDQQLPYKEQELKNSVNVVMKKYEGAEQEVDFNYETQAETLRSLLQGKVGDRLNRVISVVQKSGGFPEYGSFQGLLTKEEAESVVPLAAIYCHYIECQ